MAQEGGVPLPTGDADAAIGFLQRWAPNGPWMIIAIDPERKKPPQTQTFTHAQPKEARAWVEWWQGKRNIYFSVNRPKATVGDKKAEKADIAAALALHVDVDPAEGKEIGVERERILATLRAHRPVPSLIVDSGGGYQGFWLLREPFPIEAKKDIAAVEDRNRKIEHDLGGDHCHNVDRIMRLPGTINLPDAKKRAKGRVPASAIVVDTVWDLRYGMDDFALLEDGNGGATSSGGGAGDAESVIPRSELPEWCARVLADGPDPEGPRSYAGDRSRAVFAVACAMVRCGWTNEEIAAALQDKRNKISQHLADQSAPGTYALRQAQRARGLVGDSFTRNEAGRIVGSQRNIRLAIAKLEAELSYDAFARRALVEGPDARPRRYLDEDEIIELYLTIDERFGFRPAREFFYDVLRREARAQGFHPVRQYLDGLRWDGKKRIDAWLVDHAGAQDTPYVRAVGALVLVAAVRRVREPGCKFDEMVVLESPQGLDKSTALSVLAVREEWFTDNLPLNADSKKIIESIAGKWIVEAAELKGLHKSDVEHLKTFLSWQVDRARLSYDRVVSEVPRQCVFFGTTNADAYLKDMTGNRRFWPVRIQRFDVGLLLQHRDQLWAEASAREAAGESIRLDPALYPNAALEQERRFVDDPWTAIADKALGDYERAKVLCSDVWELVHIPPGMRNQEHNARIGEVMRALGWERLKLRFDGRPQWHYVKGSQADRAADRLVRVCIERGINGELNVYEWDGGPGGSGGNVSGDLRRDGSDSGDVPF